LTNKEKAISIKCLSKRYSIGVVKDSSFRASLAGIFKKKKKPNNDFWALKDVSFDVERGEVIGIIGKNGAGKSTLLKVLSKITQPTEGRIEINGRVASLLEVGTGFHPELTGRENIYLNGTLLGMTRKEVAEKLEEIVEFSGVRKFIDTPVKHYSSGMYVRLAFSVAAHLEPEILIIDEVLAVGDAEFQKKCLGKMKDVAGEGRTVIFVSHDLVAVRKLCNRGVLLENGQIKFNGVMEGAIRAYVTLEKSSFYYQIEKIKTNIPVAFSSIGLFDLNNEYCNEFSCEDEITIKFNFLVREEKHPYSLFVIIKDKHGVPIFSAESKIDKTTLTLVINKMFLTRGEYYVYAFIHIANTVQIDLVDNVCQFRITDKSSPLSIHGGYDYGNVFGDYTWIN
jgi:lipopolysaccharide transport system ATP-binding protein